MKKLIREVVRRTRGRDSSGINNFVGSEGLSVIAGLGVPVAPPQPILIEPASGAGIGNHSIVTLTDSQAVYALHFDYCRATNDPTLAWRIAA